MTHPPPRQTARELEACICDRDSLRKSVTELDARLQAALLEIEGLEEQNGNLAQLVELQKKRLAELDPGDLADST